MISLIATILGVSVGGCILRLVRKDRLLIKHASAWISVALMLVFAGLFPSIFDWIADRIGVAYPPTLVLLLGILALLLKALMSDIESSKLEVRLVRLAQKTSMLEADLRRQQQINQINGRSDTLGSAPEVRSRESRD